MYTCSQAGFHQRFPDFLGFGFAAGGHINEINWHRGTFLF
jgi:hypothetical protein